MSDKFYTDDSELIEVDSVWDMDFVGIYFGVSERGKIHSTHLFITTETARLIANSLINFANEVDNEREELTEKRRRAGNE